MARDQPFPPSPLPALPAPRTPGIPHVTGVAADTEEPTLPGLEAATGDLATVLGDTGVTVIFLDVHLRVCRFFPAAAGPFGLEPADIGGPLCDLAARWRDDSLPADAQAVLSGSTPDEKEITREDGRAHLRRLRLCPAPDPALNGIAITLIDLRASAGEKTARPAGDDRYRRIIEAVTGHALFHTDPAGRIATWNAGAERLLGYTPDDAIGQPLALLYPPEDRASGQPEADLDQVRVKGTAEIERWHLRKDGTFLWTNSAVSTLSTAAGARGFVHLLRDNSEHKRSEEALLQARLSAEAASEAKDLFLANVSHELRTPLSAMVLWTSLIEDQKIVDPDQLAEALSAIKRSAEEQRQLIEDLVDTSRIVAGKLRLELKEIHLAAVVAPGLDAVRALAQEKGVTIDAQLDPAADAVQADGARLKQVVANLATNAVKFTPAGGRVTVKLHRFENDVHLVVTDTGEGISPEFLPHLFDRFSQDKRIGKRPDKGLGLGLAITKQIVELHGGSITVESAGIGCGSTFTVRLPLREITGRTENALVRGDKAQLAGVLTGRRVLLIEDVAATRRALTAVLQEAGATVDAADSAPAAWEALERNRPDIIVSDLGLPTIDGYTLIRQIRAAEAETKTTPVPAVALTAFAGEGINHKAIAAGFQTCLTKPIEPLRLATTLAALAPAHQPA